MKPRTPDYWAAWIDGRCDRSPDDLSGYRSDREIYAVAVVDALFAAVEQHTLHLTYHTTPDITRLGEVALEGLRELRDRDVRTAADHAAVILGLPMPPTIDYDAYAAWRDRQEQSDG
ncbi:hypothetical protein [Gordonia sp. 852002-51296_SCH5728562-b]|uniref:hypothetical protein n=1 Tax=Gordonia sp. 852002-51296_SCH5728562-b TaxID=1834101 RepID=UPI0007E9DDF0|nr:hypothetical protein [Gordonia sp. 852002-51296_SCH5728562-b]OBA40771.1 hypothetical protein A5766_01905 [Gordonia sp. 852002-51296_SCH5728562-b]